MERDDKSLDIVWSLLTYLRQILKYLSFLTRLDVGYRL